MQAGPSPAREARLRHRHGVRTLSYVTLDQGNGGILLNLTRQGVAVQTVASVRIGQQVQVRFDLLAPRVRVNARGEVVWATSSGRCGIWFLDLSPQTARQLDEWTFAKLLEGSSPLTHPAESTFAGRPNQPAVRLAENRIREAGTISEHEDEHENLGEHDNDDLPNPVDTSVENLIVSAGRVKTIELPTTDEARLTSISQAAPATFQKPDTQLEGQLDWLSQPLSGRSLAWTVNALVVAAGWLLSVLVFLSVLREIPKWPVTMVLGAAIVVAGLYWGFFRMFAGASLGAKLAQLTATARAQDEPLQDRFR
jgi:PilZ domain